MSTRIACKVTRFNWSHRLLCWAVTLFMLMCLSQVGLLAQACIANPTNYMVHAVSAPMPVSQANIVPIVDERIQSLPVSAPKSSVFQEGFDYGKSLWDNWYDSSDSKVIAFVIAFIIAVLVIGYMIYKLIQLLDKVIPPSPPPQSPTNSPPVVINPSGSPGPATSSLVPHKMLLDTNQPAWGVITNYSIAGLNYENSWEKTGVKMMFDHYWSVGMSTTTNFVDWEDSNYQVEAFITSGVGVFYRYRHYGTNYYNCYYNSYYFGTNHNAAAYFNLTDKPYRPIQFFRLIPR